VERTLEAVEASPGSPRVFLVHPWELVDPPPGAIPAWMRTACSSDASTLDAFLDRAKQRYGFATFEEGPEESIRPEDWREGDARSDTRPPASLFLVTNVYAPVVGGITSYVGNLDRALGDRFRTRILAYPTVLVRFEAAHPRHVLRWFVHVAFGGYAFLRVLADRLRGRDVIVHSHSAAFCLVAGYLGRLAGARAVHTFHSPLGYHSRTLEFASHRLDALVYVSPATRTNYVDASETWNDRERILPGAVDLPPEVTEDERQALRKRFERSLGIPSDHALVLSAGRVVEDKGIHVLARAAGMLAGERISVVVAGPPGRTSADRRYVEGLRALADLGGRFQLLGEVPRDMLHDLFRAADVVAIPSVWAEPAPMSAVEAMAHGRPVVASRIGGLPFLVPDGVGGILVPPGDASALADALRTIARDAELRSRLSRGARARAEAHHALRTFGIEHARLYGSL
jgi:glycosyltransferase involved in cell wall biosynthesis